MKILGFEVPIEFVDDKFDTNHMGMYSQKNSLIKIDKSLPIDTRLETILHEVFECIVNVNEIPIEHRDLTILSNVLYQVLKDNGGSIRRWK